MLSSNTKSPVNNPAPPSRPKGQPGAASSSSSHSATAPKSPLNNSVDVGGRTSRDKRPQRKPRVIIIAIDDSEESQDALAWALENVVKRNDRICLSTLGFVPNTTWSDYFRMLVKGTQFSVEKAMELETKAREVAMARLQQASDTIQAHSENLDEEYDIIYDILAASKGSVDPRDFILDMCRSRDANLLVVGARERHAGYGLTGGVRTSDFSVSEHMARFSPCPVLIVRGLEPEEKFDVEEKEEGEGAREGDAGMMATPGL